MSYSYSELAEDVVAALNVSTYDPDDSDTWDDASGEADAALEEIQRLQRIEKEFRHAIAVFADKKDTALFVARMHAIAEHNKPKESA